MPGRMHIRSGMSSRHHLVHRSGAGSACPGKGQESATDVPSWRVEPDRRAPISTTITTSRSIRHRKRNHKGEAMSETEKLRSSATAWLAYAKRTETAGRASLSTCIACSGCEAESMNRCTSSMRGQQRSPAAAANEHQQQRQPQNGRGDARTERCKLWLLDTCRNCG